MRWDEGGEGRFVIDKGDLGEDTPLLYRADDRTLDIGGSRTHCGGHYYFGLFEYQRKLRANGVMAVLRKEEVKGIVSYGNAKVGEVVGGSDGG